MMLAFFTWMIITIFVYQNLITSYKSLQLLSDFLQKWQAKWILNLYGFFSNMKGFTKVTKQISGKSEVVFKTFKRLFRNLSDVLEMARLANQIGNRCEVETEELKRIVNE